MTVDELLTRFGFQLDPQGLQKADRAIENFKKRSRIALLAVGGAMAGIGAMAVKTAMDFESLNAEFTVLLGNAEKANAFTKEIRKFAEVTPFEVKGIAENARLLLSFGMSQEKVMPTLQMLGDVAGKNSEKFAALSYAYGLVSSTGRLSGREWMQMVRSGFNPLQLIAEKTGKSMEVLREEMSKGLITIDHVNDAFRTVTSAGGMFYQNMLMQSQTLGGIFSNLQDTITEVLGSLGEAFLPALKRVLGGGISFIERFAEGVVGTLQGVVEPLMAMGLMVAQVGKVFVEQLLGVALPTAEGLEVSLTHLAERLAYFLNQHSESIALVINAVVVASKALVSVVGGLFSALGALAGRFVWVLQGADGLNTSMQKLRDLMVVIASAVVAGKLAGSLGAIATAYVAMRTAVLGFIAVSKATLVTQAIVIKTYITQLGLLASMKAGVLALGGAFRTLMASVSPVLAVAAAAASVAWALTRIKKAMDEIDRKRQDELNQQQDQAVAEAMKAKALQMKADRDALQALQGQGRGATAEARALEERIKGAQRYIDSLRSASRKLSKERRQFNEDEQMLKGFAMGDFSAHLDLISKNATIDAQRSVSQNSKTMNIVNDFELTVNAPQDESGRTTLTPAALGGALDEMARSVFSVQLKNLLTRSV